MKVKGIALCGKAGAGKDTVQQSLVNFDSRFVRLAFADALKEEASRLTGLNFFDEKVKEQHRWFLTAFGTDLMRKWDTEYWVKKTLAKLPLFESSLPVITDCRFPNEAQPLKDRGFLVVRLEASAETRAARGRPDKTHASEVALDDYTGYDFVFHTDNVDPDDIARAILREVDARNFTV